MKVLDVTEFYSERGGGVRSHLALKSHVLCQLGAEHVVVAPGAEDHAPLARGPGSARVIRIRGPASPYDPTYHLLVRFDKIRAIVEAERPDVLEIHSPYLAALGALRVPRAFFGVRTFQWHSDFIDTYAEVLASKLPEPASTLSFRATRPLWSIVKSIGKRCDATLVAAAWQMAKLASHGVPRLERVPFGIEHSVFRPDRRSEDRRVALLAACGLGRDAKLLVGVGRFAVEKRWDVVIDAWSELRARGVNAGLVMIGDGPERERIKARVTGGVTFTGFMKDRVALAETLASADGLVHGCPYETFGLSIAEAAGAGLAAVVPDEGGAREVVFTGETYRALDVVACADAVERLLARVTKAGDLLRNETAERARLLPSVEAQFEGQLAIYSSLLRKAGKQGVFTRD